MFVKLLAASLIIISLFGCASGQIRPEDAAWKAGQPWPLHWGTITPGGEEHGWNRVFPMVMNKVYDKDWIRYTRLRDIPEAMEDNAAVEVCRIKKGITQTPQVCFPAIVTPELRGKLQKHDVVALFLEKPELAAGSTTPLAPDRKIAMRVFQKLASADEDACWEWHYAMFKTPTTQNCLNRIDKNLIEAELERDFGPKR